MTAVRIKLTAEMAEGKDLAVVADQRDFAKLEVQAIPEAAVATRMRFLAWSAAYRDKTYKGSFAEFNEVDCIEVASEDAAEADGLDPGSPEALATD